MSRKLAKDKQLHAGVSFAFAFFVLPIVWWVIDAGVCRWCNISKRVIPYFVFVQVLLSSAGGWWLKEMWDSGQYQNIWEKAIPTGFSINDWYASMAGAILAASLYAILFCFLMTFPRFERTVTR